MSKIHRLTAIGLAASALVSASPYASVAQAQTKPGSSQTIPEKTPSSAERLKEQQGPSTLRDGRSDSLSKQLDRSGGVITPSGTIDPGMNVPAPVANPNSTPVVPPSATGGETAK